MINNLLCVTIALLAIGYSPAAGDVFLSQDTAIPDSVKSIENAQSLQKYIDSKLESDRVAACIRLGEIGGRDSYELLLETFENEPVKGDMDSYMGVKYYSLASMGRTGIDEAQDYLIEMAWEYSAHLQPLSPYSEVNDSLSVIEGALEGLYQFGSPTAIACLDSIFQSEEYYWLVRSRANLMLLKYELRNDSISTSSDTARFLINRLDKSGGPFGQFESDGSISRGFIVQNNIFSMVYDLKAITLPYLTDFVSGLSDDDPRIASLKRLMTDMENNPPGLGD
jgi:hypothetical protein